jgi:hypothetical protein
MMPRALQGAPGGDGTWFRQVAEANRVDARIATGVDHDGHRDLKTDYVFANPPFNAADWRSESLREDKRWACGVSPGDNDCRRVRTRGEGAK